MKAWGPGTSDTFLAYNYSTRDWLSSIASLAFGYDLLGNRTSITSGTNVTRFTINPNAGLLHAPGRGLPLT
jgi:hypothetical protein